MFNEIEEKFKNKSKYYKNALIIFAIITLIYLVGVIILKPNNVVYIFLLSIVIYVFIYIYIVYKNVKSKLYSKNKWKKIFNIRYSMLLYFNNERKEDINLLKNILKETGFNGKPKINQLIEHYRIYIPRSVNGGGVLLSILAVFISIGTFVYDQDASLVNEKVKLIFEILFIVMIGWSLYLCMAKTIGNMFSKKSFYLRLEDLLTEIYIKYDYKK